MLHSIKVWSMDKTHLILSFAHRGEAQSFLKERPFKPISQNLYQWEDEDALRTLIICGEGLDITILSLAKILGQKKARSIINLGICGHIKRPGEVFRLGQAVQVRTTMKAYQNNELAFKTFTTEDLELPLPKADSISTEKRILNKDNHEKLQNFASLVDRESWANGFVANHYQIPFSVIKIVSDFADGEFCQAVKEEAAVWSDSLLREYVKWENLILDKPSTEEKSNASEFPELYFTISQERSLNNLLKALYLKGKTLDQIKGEAQYSAICSLKLHPKQKTKIFIERIKDSLNPLEKELREKLQLQTKNLSQAGYQIRFDNGFEKETLHLSISLNSDEELKRAKRALDQFNYQKYKSIIKGEDLV